jgi:hypothetical protein
VEIELGVGIFGVRFQLTRSLQADVLPNLGCLDYLFPLSPVEQADEVDFIEFGPAESKGKVEAVTPEKLPACREVEERYEETVEDVFEQADIRKALFIEDGSGFVPHAEPTTPERLPVCADHEKHPFPEQHLVCPHVPGHPRDLGCFYHGRCLPAAAVVAGDEIEDDSWVSEMHAQDWAAHLAGLLDAKDLRDDVLPELTGTDNPILDGGKEGGAAELPITPVKEPVRRPYFYPRWVYPSPEFPDVGTTEHRPGDAPDYEPLVIPLG